MIKFTPNKECTYKFDYERLFADIASGKLPRIPTYRSLVKNDLWFIVNFVMEIPGANRPFVVDRCAEIDADDEIIDAAMKSDKTDKVVFYLDLWARYHYKSSILTKARTLKRIFRYPDKCTGIFSHTRPIAKGFLRGIKLLLQNSVMLKEWFPDVLYATPDTESDKWSEDDGIIVKRSNFSRSESTVEAWGLIEGMPTSKHFDFLIFDDVETDEAVSTPEMVEKVRTRFDLARNLKTENGIEGIVGTPYSHLGIYYPFLVGKKRANGENVFRLRKYAVVDEAGKSRLLAEDNIADIKASTSEYVYNCQQMCDPTPPGTRKLDSTLLKEIEDRFIPKDIWRFMVIDPSGEGTNKKADAWAMGVIGIKPVMDNVGASDIYILDLVIDTMTTPEATNKAVQMYTSNGIIMRLGVEKVGQSTAEIHIANALRSRGRRIDQKDKTLVILTPQGRPKIRRIEDNIGWPLVNNKVHISRSVHQDYRDRLKTEMDKFPHWHDDGLDMLAYFYDLIKDYRFMPFDMRIEKMTPKIANSYAVRM